ncbi:unnamed protein product [Lactuca saligna]|uniref:F-box domain-containing protein n=1 Tax=Lactuca saligna TaxID=75948 RepID=A0AA36DW30_LACSI|nr:unnamed protein product [Lactuca saligna]
MEATALQKLMKMTIGKFRKEFEYEHMTRNQNKVNGVVFFPDDILLDILKRLPDAFLRYKAKYVCRRWFHIITNMILLDHASFILQKPTGIYRARHVDIREERQGLEVKERYLHIPCTGRIESWCNEFLLIRDLDRKGSVYLFNLITKEGSYLPLCISCVGRYFCLCGVALSFDGLKRVYKVLRVSMGPPMQCDILILKKDIVSCVSSKWKNIKVPCYMSQGMSSWFHPVSVQGKYFHWSANLSKYLVSMDMVKEKFFQLHLPKSSGDRMINLYSVFEMGGFLTLIGGVSLDKVYIWSLKDFRRMEWEKLQLVTFPDQYFRIYPISTVISKRYIIFKDSESSKIRHKKSLSCGDKPPVHQVYTRKKKCPKVGSPMNHGQSSFPQGTDQGQFGLFGVPNSYGAGDTESGEDV